MPVRTLTVTIGVMSVMSFCLTPALTRTEITGAIIATTLVTVAVYAPIGFYGGVVGTIYKQFAVTMCVALCLSTVNALTLSPAS